MEHESGDCYVRRLAAFIRENEKCLAESGFTRRRGQRPTSFQDSALLRPLTWLSVDTMSAPPKSVVLSSDVYHLFYVLMRLEALGYDVGTLDVQIDHPSRPTSYSIFSHEDKSETLTLASFRSSLSTVSRLSLGAAWWSRPPQLSLDNELKYLYSCFTKLPALSLHAPGTRVISELREDSCSSNAVPLDAFKNMQILECSDVDPRTIIGWDRLSISLRSLKVRRSGMDDVSDIFIGAVIDDQARRQGSASRKRRRMITRGVHGQANFPTTTLPDTVKEDEDGEDLPDGRQQQPILPSSPTREFSSSLSLGSWALLKHLALPDNSLTTFPADVLPYLTSLTHLDLSSNLLVSIPSGLKALYNLISLNLSDNMIDSVMGIYLDLGQVLRIDLSQNRLENICGLERLLALELVDLRSNLIEESAEIGRLALLPNIADVWIEGNPFVDIEAGYRTLCFNYFWKEGKSILLDGSPPGYYERQRLSARPQAQTSTPRSASSPPIVAVSYSLTRSAPGGTAAVRDLDSLSPPSSSNPSPRLPLESVGTKGDVRRTKKTRIVDLDGNPCRDNGNQASQGKILPSVSSREASTSTILTETGRVASSSPRTEGSKVDSSISPRQIITDTPMRSLSPRTHRQLSQETSMPAVGGHNDRLTACVHTLSQSRTTDYLAPRESNLSLHVSSASPPACPNDTSPGPAKWPPSPGAYKISAASSDEVKTSADSHRKRIEALKKEMGEGWLKVYSQTQGEL